MSNHFHNSIAIRHLVCGSCNGCEHEMNALANGFYDITQFGWEITASPRHADILTVTGPMTEAMRAAAARTVAAVARPRVILAVGDCAAGCGPWSGANAAGEGSGLELEASIVIHGCPPTPDQVIDGVREAIRRDGTVQTQAFATGYTRIGLMPLATENAAREDRDFEKERNDPPQAPQ